ncbi:MAG: hypothetical protein ACI4WX_11125 [Aristaeellaceae bacterium]
MPIIGFHLFETTLYMQNAKMHTDTHARLEGFTSHRDFFFRQSEAYRTHAQAKRSEAGAERRCGTLDENQDEFILSEGTPFVKRASPAEMTQTVHFSGFNPFGVFILHRTPDCIPFEKCRFAPKCLLQTHFPSGMMSTKTAAKAE